MLSGDVAGNLGAVPNLTQTGRSVDGDSSVASGAEMSARLAREVRRRRGELGLSQQALARNSGISLATLGAIESGRKRNYTEPVLAALDAGLGWGAGVARRILDDDEQLRRGQRDEPDAGFDPAELAAMLRDYRAALERFAETGRRPVDEVSTLIGALDDEQRGAVVALLRLLVRRH